MADQNVQVSGNPTQNECELYYTGTDLGGADVVADLKVGDVVALWPVAPVKGRGFDVGQFTTAYLMQPAFVITHVPKDSRQGGNVRGVPIVRGGGGSNALLVNTKLNMVFGATLLGPVNQAFYLGAPTTSVASGAANATGVLSIKAIAMETVDTSAAAAIKWVAPI